MVSFLALTPLALVVLFRASSAYMFRKRDGVFGDHEALGTSLVYPSGAKLEVDFVNYGVARAGVAVLLVATTPLNAL